MQFRLTYEGPLYGVSGRNNQVDHKHDLRRAFHKQLKVLWDVHPVLSNWFYDHYKGQEKIKVDEFMADQVPSLGNYKFVPLIHEIHQVLCGIDILYLRPGIPGKIMQAGDIDNKLKVIFDALQMPKAKDQLGSYQEPGEGETPLYVLTQDDELFNKISVETDTLYSDSTFKDEARLVISVDIRMFVATMHNEPFV